MATGLLEELLSYIKTFKTLNKMAIRDKETLKGYFETGDTPTESNFSDLIDTQFNGLSVLPLRLVTNVTQIGTDAPTSTDLVNTFGSYTWSYIAGGYYQLNFASVSWNPSYVAVSINSNNTGRPYLITPTVVENHKIEILVYDIEDQIYVDGVLNKSTLVVEAYFD